MIFSLIFQLMSALACLWWEGSPKWMWSREVRISAQSMFAFIDFIHPWSPSPLAMGRAFPQPRCSTHPPVFILNLLAANSAWEHLSQKEWDVKGRSRTGWHFGEGLQYRLVPERGSIEPPAPRVRRLLPRTLQSGSGRRTLPVYGLWPTRLLCPWESPGKNAGVGCHAHLKGSSLPRDWILIS